MISQIFSHHTEEAAAECLDRVTDAASHQYEHATVMDLQDGLQHHESSSGAASHHSLMNMLQSRWISVLDQLLACFTASAMSPRSKQEIRHVEDTFPQDMLSETEPGSLTA